MFFKNERPAKRSPTGNGIWKKTTLIPACISRTGATGRLHPIKQRTEPESYYGTRK
jgi:hypothetical protein